MDHKTKGVVLGLAGVILWFMPLADFGFMGLKLYQSGPQVGDLAYLLLAASAAYTGLSWTEQHQLRIVTAAFATAIALFFVIEFGSKAAWGLYLFIVVSGVSWITAYCDHQKSKKAPQEAGG